MASKIAFDQKEVLTSFDHHSISISASTRCLGRNKDLWKAQFYATRFIPKLFSFFSTQKRNFYLRKKLKSLFFLDMFFYAPLFFKYNIYWPKFLAINLQVLICKIYITVHCIPQGYIIFRFFESIIISTVNAS